MTISVLDPQLAEFFDVFIRAGHECYLVGGAVRDHLRGAAFATLRDLDFATSALPQESARVLRRAGYTVFTVGSRFGTVGTILHDPAGRREIQVTTYRGEVYANASRKPRVTFGKDLESDLARRDFSINAMAMSLEGILIDPYGGAHDLEQGVLRTVGDPRVIFREDPLRTLRAARFIATLGMRPESGLADVVREVAAEILNVSRERWLMEMNKVLLGHTAESGLMFLAETGLLGLLWPAGQAMVDFKADQGRFHHKALWAHTLGVVMQAPARTAVRWAALLHDAGKVTTRSVDAEGEVHFFGHEAVSAALVNDVAQRFRFDKALQQQVNTLVLLHQRPASYDGSWTDGAVRRLVRDAGEAFWDLLDLSRADVTSHRPGIREGVLVRIAELRQRAATLIKKDGQKPPLPKGIGGAIMEHYRLSAGPEVGVLRTELEQAVLDGLLPRDAPFAAYLAYLDRVHPRT